MQIYNTEYGYETNPPNRTDGFVSPATAASYINWAEYLSWKNSRVATTMQYLLMDPNPRGNVPEFGGFASGLEFYGGAHKPSYDAYRLPLYLPSNSTRPGGSLEVWGAVRPARYAAADSREPQSGQVQFAPGSSGSFATIATVPINDPRGYFDVRVAHQHRPDEQQHLHAQKDEQSLRAIKAGLDQPGFELGLLGCVFRHERLAQFGQGRIDGHFHRLRAGEIERIGCLAGQIVQPDIDAALASRNDQDHEKREACRAQKCR